MKSHHHGERIRPAGTQQRNKQARELNEQTRGRGRTSAREACSQVETLAAFANQSASAKARAHSRMIGCTGSACRARGRGISPSAEHWDSSKSERRLWQAEETSRDEQRITATGTIAIKSRKQQRFRERNIGEQRARSITALCSNHLQAQGDTSQLLHSSCSRALP